MTTGTASADIVAVSGLCKSFGAVPALKLVSFAVRAGEIHALCGENGAGKSTLVKCLTGLYRPDAGEITVEGSATRIGSPREAQGLGIALVAQELSLCPDLSVLDNIWLGSVKTPFFHRKIHFREQARAALDRLGADNIALDRPLSTLGLGERQLVEIARLLTRDAKLLILDEPTATLTDNEIARIFAALRGLRAQGRSVLYITHRLSEVFALCDRVTVLRNGEHIETRDTAAFDRQSLIESMLGRGFAELYPDEQKPAGETVLTVQNLSAPGRFTNIGFTVPRGKILGLAGQIGSGASEIVGALAGLAYDATGHVHIAGQELRLGSSAQAAKAGAMFVSGDRAVEGIFRHLPVFDNLIATRLASRTRLGFLNRAGLRREASSLAQQAGIDANRLGANADTLSGGNQQKIAFARCLDREGGHVLLMNEPTRGVDVGARAEIYRLMREFCAKGYGLVMASSDLEEVLGLSDTILTLYRGRIVGEYARGNKDMGRLLSDITHPPVLAPILALVEAAS